MKLRNLHIEDYKMFKNFDIDFLDENDEALPIVVLAGVNGSGKTTLLESLKNLNTETMKLEFLNENYPYNFNDSYPSRVRDVAKIASIAVPGIGAVAAAATTALFNQDIEKIKGKFIYFSSGIDDTRKVADEFVKTFYFFLKEKDYRPSEITEHFHKYMRDIFDDLDISFQYSHLDKEDNVYFSSSENDEYYYTVKKNDNKEDTNVFTLDELSTGEKTLLSKVLYLYFQDYKDKVVLIDEPELSLHPSWQNKVLKIYENFAKENNCQIIIATHSPHIIGSAKPEYLRVLKKVNDKIEVAKYTKSYGLEFNKILTDIMGAETRVSDVSERLSKIKSLIIQNDFNSDEFKTIWSDLERLIGIDNIDLRLLKLEIASRKKNVSNN